MIAFFSPRQEVFLSILYGVMGMDKKQSDKYRKLGLNIAYYRKNSRDTQQELAELLNIDRTHMGNIVLARTGVSLDIVFNLSDILQVPVYKFFEFRE